MEIPGEISAEIDRLQPTDRRCKKVVTPMDIDASYAVLRQQGFLGWGGAAAPRRLDGWRRLLEKLLKDGWLPEPPARLHELGCGNAMLSLLAARRGYVVSGTDMSREAVAWARQRFADAGMPGSFHRGDVCAMSSIQDRSFDIVVDGNCLHCLFEPDRDRCLREVRRVLIPGGVVVVSSMCGLPRRRESIEQYDRTRRCLMRDGRPYRTLKSGDEIEKELVDVGFRVLNRNMSANAWWDHVTIVAATP